MPVNNATTTTTNESKRVNADYSPIILEERNGNDIYARLNPIDGKKVPADGFIHVASYTSGKAKDGTDGYIVTNPDGQRFNNDAEAKLHLAVLYASRKFVSFEVSRLYGDNAGRQQYKAIAQRVTAYADIVTAYTNYRDDDETALDMFNVAMIDEHKETIIGNMSQKTFDRIRAIVTERQALLSAEAEAEAETNDDDDDTTNDN